MKIAIIGSGPAGLTSAKQAMERGHEVVVYEKLSKLGGIWNPDSGGAYENVRMQSSVMSFHFSDFEPYSISEFPDVEEVYEYLHEYAKEFSVLEKIEFDTEVCNLAKEGHQWNVTVRHGGKPGCSIDAVSRTEKFDSIMIATGELWEPIMPELGHVKNSEVRYLSAKEYQNANEFEGKRVLVVGGGVSGADISSELTGKAARIDWSIRKKHLFFPRHTGEHLNDELFSYIARAEVQNMSRKAYLSLLDDVMPEYMDRYRNSGLLPEEFENNAIYVNEKIIDKVLAGEVGIKPAFHNVNENGDIEFKGGEVEKYDIVIFSLGYGFPNYSFIQDFERSDLYRHFIYRKDPSLAVINTPVDTYAFGTACPYFESIANWVLCVFEEHVRLPSDEVMDKWCEENMHELKTQRYYDCWLETITLSLETGVLKPPSEAFNEYWNVVASKVSPSYLHRIPARPVPGKFDHAVDTESLKARVLASLPIEDRSKILERKEISFELFERAKKVTADQVIPYDLSY